MHVKLVLATGSKAGIEETLQPGYYMIGRHKECQIRPKSRSVSRRHCLLHRSEKSVKAFDLGSTNGTKINARSLEPNQWVALKDGDQLQCGKIKFTVSLDLPPPKSASPDTRSASQDDAASNSATRGTAPATRESAILRGDAWPEFDIVGFLQSEDEAERRRLYGSAPARVTAAAERELDSDEAASDSILATSIHLLDGDVEAQAVLDEARRKARNTSDPSRTQAALRARRIEEIQAKLALKQRKQERENEINEQLRRMLRRDAHR